MNRGYLEMKDKNAPVFFLSGHEDQIMMMVGISPKALKSKFGKRLKN